MYAFDLTMGELVRSLEDDLLGFRMWRTLTKMVKTTSGPAMVFRNNYVARSLPGRVRTLLGNSASLRTGSAFPARSLDLETAIAVPGTWILPGIDWAGHALRLRALNESATIRERATAAHGLARHRPERHLQWRRDVAQQVTASFPSNTERNAVEGGYLWLSATLSAHLSAEVLPEHGWPESDTQWAQAVQRAASSLDHLPSVNPEVLVGTKRLFLHVVLQNDGILRRTAIDTIVAANVSEFVVRALTALLDDKETPSWIRIRAVFALGFLRHRTPETQSALVSAVRHAAAELDHAHDNSAAVEMHQALFSLGDCLGASAPRVSELAAATIRDLRSELTLLLTHTATRKPRGDCSSDDLHTNRYVDRALLYVLKHVDRQGELRAVASRSFRPWLDRREQRAYDALPPLVVSRG